MVVNSGHTPNVTQSVHGRTYELRPHPASLHGLNPIKAADNDKQIALRGTGA